MSAVEFEDVNIAPRKNESPTPTQETPTSQHLYKYSMVELPSNGILGYAREVEYRDILVKDEKELASTTEKTFQPILNGVLKGLLKDSSIYNDLTIYDRDFLILWIWANNYSTTKNIEYSCPVCEAKNTHDVDLTKLPVTVLPEDFKNPYPYTLSNGQDVTFRLLTVKDEEIARKFCMNNKYDETFVMMAMSVTFKTVMGLKAKLIFIEDNMTGKDMATLRGFHKHYKYGVDDVVEASCIECGEVSKLAVPFQVDFFIPTISDDFK